MGILNLVNYIFGFLYPIRCIACNRYGQLICDSCSSKLKVQDNQQCYICSKTNQYGQTCEDCKVDFKIDGVYVLMRNSDLLDKILYDIKYNLYYSYSDYLLEAILKKTDLSEFINSLNPCITYIPQHRSRERWRGFNQSKLIADKIGDHYGLITEKVLTKAIHTKHQVGLSREHRLQNIAGSLKLNPLKLEKTIVIVDDIVTTGATLNEAAITIKSSSPIDVWAIVLSRGT